MGGLRAAARICCPDAGLVLVACLLTSCCSNPAGGGGGAAHGNPNDYVTYAGLTLKKPPTWEYALSKLIGGTMW
jgi:hypothetical protein